MTTRCCGIACGGWWTGTDAGTGTGTDAAEATSRLVRTCACVCQCKEKRKWKRRFFRFQLLQGKDTASGSRDMLIFL
jgi:hypothetical protein